MLGKIENMKRLYISNITSVFKCLQQLALDVIYFVVKIFKSMHCLNVIHIKLFFFMVSPFISFFFSFLVPFKSWLQWAWSRCLQMLKAENSYLFVDRGGFVSSPLFFIEVIFWNQNYIDKFVFPVYRILSKLFIWIFSYVVWESH